MSETFLKKSQLDDLKSSLPKGYAKKIKQKLKETKGKDYLESSIRRGLMFEHQSESIIDAAIQVALEHKAVMEQREKELNNLGNE